MDSKVVSKGLAPVITIDGPTASGKGTVALGVASALGWHVLDSGALYRLTAFAAYKAGVNIEHVAEVTNIAASLDIMFTSEGAVLHGSNVEHEIRQEHIGKLASVVAAYSSVRKTLLDRQRAFRVSPGLVADGRDMGTVIFPDAPLKIFLIASVQARAERRYKQLISKGISAKLSDLTQDLQERDERDKSRLN